MHLEWRPLSLQPASSRPSVTLLHSQAGLKPTALQSRGPNTGTVIQSRAKAFPKPLLTAEALSSCQTGARRGGAHPRGGTSAPATRVPGQSPALVRELGLLRGGQRAGRDPRVPSAAAAAPYQECTAGRDVGVAGSAAPGPGAVGCGWAPSRAPTPAATTAPAGPEPRPPTSFSPSLRSAGPGKGPSVPPER